MTLLMYLQNSSLLFIKDSLASKNNVYLDISSIRHEVTELYTSSYLLPYALHITTVLIEKKLKSSNVSAF